MSKVDLTDSGSVINRRNYRTVDLENKDYIRLVDVIHKGMLVAANFSPEKIGAKADAYRDQFTDLYMLLARYACIAFANDFQPEMISKPTIEKMAIPDGEVALTFVYTQARKDKTYRITFRSPMAPITTKWPDQIIAHGGKPVIKEHFQYV